MRCVMFNFTGAHWNHWSDIYAARPRMPRAVTDRVPGSSVLMNLKR